MPEELVLLQTKVRQVRRRQLLQQLLWFLPFFLTAAVVLAGIWYVVQPFTGVALAWPEVLGILCGLALVASVVVAWLRRGSPVESALALDEAFNLRERITTAVSLDDEQRTSPAGVALLEDAKTKITDIDVPAKFPLRVHRTAACLPIAAVALALLIIFYNPIRTAQAIAAKPIDPTPQKKVDLAKAEEVKQQILARRKRVRELDSEKLEELTTQLDKLLERVENAQKDDDVQLAMKDLSQLAAEMQQRQKELEKLKALQQQLKNNPDLKKGEDGPAKDFQDALSKGDIEEAKKALEKIANDLKAGKLSEEDKKKLAQQLGDLQKKLKEVAELKQRRDNIAKSNLDPETKKKELQKIDREMQKMQDLAKLSEKLSQCQQCMQKGDAQELAKALDEATAMLGDMKREAEEAEMLALAMEDLEKLKEALGVKEPKGASGDGEEAEDEGESSLEEMEDPEEKPGLKGRRKGGLRKETANDTNSKDERARSPLDPTGKIRFVGKGAEQPKPDRDSIGKTTVEVAPGLTDIRQQATEALRQQKVPQPQRDVVSDFYKNLVEKKEKK